MTDSEATQPNFPDLCHKCGRCCRVATTFNDHGRLLELAEQGNEEALDFLSIFKPYPSHDAASKVVPEQVEQVLAEWAHRGTRELESITFYYCQHVTEEGLCGIYERRPRVCREAPYHGWSGMPPGCGFEGWQFVQRETQRAEVRKLKQLQLHMEILSPDGVHLPTRNMTLAQLDEIIEDKLKPWKTYGADKW